MMHCSFSAKAILAIGSLFFSKIALAAPTETDTITAQSTARPSVAAELIDVLRKNNPMMVARNPQGGDSTPDNQPIQPVDGRPVQQGGGIDCGGGLPSWTYPGFFSRSDFNSNRNLCANSRSGGNVMGNLGGYCNNRADPPVVAFDQTQANFDLYNDNSFMIHCFVNCYCQGQRNHRARPDGLIPYGDNVFIDVANYGYVLVYGASTSPTSTSTVLATGLARPSARRSLDYSNRKGPSATSTTTREQTPPSNLPPANLPPSNLTPASGSGAAPLVNPTNPNPEQGQCGFVCSSNAACDYDNTAGTSKADVQSCGVCELDPPTNYNDPVFPQGRCAQAVPLSLLMTVTSLLGRGIPLGNASSGNLSSVLPPLPQYNLTDPRACACNTTFVHLLCCGYHNGTLPADAGKSLGTVEVASA